ncbi:hypothetical protein B0H17DRAFT_1081354 [Mycena rosella]|uniref:Uncharacterized protein n=1 Tax=Mycena rosella TaxID=1033263 RepID=A0AAD7D2P5_MYCRO|nr:hypothetical protein B0H17DRAFT_1081354 [Mycena rosella]
MFPAAQGTLHSVSGGAGRRQTTIHFPDHTRGFLYYQSEPHARPLEGRLRFRLTPDRSPSSFSDGKDLPSRRGIAWQILLVQIACPVSHAGIAAQLLHENMVTEDQLARCRELKLPYFNPMAQIRVCPLRALHTPRARGRRLVHLRIVEIVEPVVSTVDPRTYTGSILQPEEGQLFTVVDRWGIPAPWACDIDRPERASVALRALWANSPTP